MKTIPLPPDHVRSVMLLMDVPLPAIQVHRSMTFHEGKAAAVFGADLTSDNPYRDTDERHSEWRLGFLAAELRVHD